MWDKIKARYQALSNPVRAGLATALQTFMALWLPTAFGWVGSVIEWWMAQATDATVRFPTPNVLVSAAIAASGSAAAGLLALVYRAAQARGILGGNPPQYDTTNARPHGRT